MSDLAFLVINASVVCFVVAYGLLKAFRSKLLVACLVFSPFILIPAFSGSLQKWMVGYVFILQYGGLGLVVAILLFEIDQIKRSKKLRYLTSMAAKGAIAFAGLYIFIYSAKAMITGNARIQNSLEYASLFGLVKQKDTMVAEYLGSFFTFGGVVMATLIIMACLGVMGFNKFRAFKEVYRV